MTDRKPAADQLRWSHDAECETELTSHGYTPCRCEDRALTSLADSRSTRLGRTTAKSAPSPVRCILGAMPKRQKRGYSREFTPRKASRRIRFEIDRIPATLYAAVKSKAKRERVSLRTLTLRLWTAWLKP